MSDFQSTADRVEIEALRGEFTDTVMMRDPDRLASLFTEDGVWRMPYINVELTGREQIRAGSERLQGQWDYFVQTTHPGTIQLLGDTAIGRAYVSELIHLRDGKPSGSAKTKLRPKGPSEGGLMMVVPAACNLACNASTSSQSIQSVTPHPG